MAKFVMECPRCGKFAEAKTGFFARKKIITAIGVVVTVSIIVVYMVVTKVVIPNNNYNNAVALMNSGKYEDAVNIFEALNGYKDSDSLKATAEISIIANASIGDNVAFGDYNGNTEWRVLAKEDGKILVISKYALEERQYNTEYTSITWEKCTLRSWLNNEYLTSAFSNDERSRIIEVSINNPDNAEYGTDGGNNTTDKVFLLSIDAVNKYFTSDSAREAVLSDGTSVWWWLRSPGYDSGRVAVVDYDGSANGFGNYVYFGSGAVRPALWIDISNL